MSPSPSWRDLEREVVALLREHKFDTFRDGDVFLRLDFDFPVSLNLTTFAKDLARRMEDRR